MIEIYNIDFYIKDLKRLILDFKGVYTTNYLIYLNNISLVDLEKEFHKYTDKSYYELTGNKIRF